MLACVRPFSASFIALYLSCGVTDALDGYLARKWHVESTWGAKIDSVADLVFFAVVLYTILTVLVIPWALVVWTFFVLALRVIGLLAAFTKYRLWAVLHTYANKLTGFAFFCFPLFYGLTGAEAAGTVLLLIATYATIEEATSIPIRILSTLTYGASSICAYVRRPTLFSGKL